MKMKILVIFLLTCFFVFAPPFMVKYDYDKNYIEKYNYTTNNKEDNFQTQQSQTQNTDNNQSGDLMP